VVVSLITIEREVSTFLRRRGERSVRLHNQLVLQERSGQTVIIAVGAPEEWASREPLPSDARVVDLVGSAVSDPNTAGILWARFLRFLLHSGSDRSSGHALLRPLLASWFRVPVSLVIGDAATRAAVSACVEQAARSMPLRLERSGNEGF
jgi:hypothetical protein